MYVMLLPTSRVEIGKLIDNAMILFKPPAGSGGAVRYVTWLANTFDMPIYTLYEPDGPLTPGWEEADIRGFGCRRELPVVGRRIGGDFLDRYEYAFWKPPAEYDIVISSGLPTKATIHHPSQKRIHLMHGFHKGAFGLPPRDTFSSNPFVELFQKVNRASLRTREQYGLKRADHLVSNSNYTADAIDFYYNLSVGSVLTPPIDYGSFYSDRPTNEKFYLFVSNLEPYKNVEQIVRAFNERSERLVVAGSGSLEEQLAEIADSNVDIVGYVSEERKRELLAECEGFIQNSHAETFGVATVEALASGTPIIAVEDGNNPYLVEDGTNGVLYEPSDRTTPLSAAVDRASDIDWDHDQIESDAEQYGYETAEENWRTLLESC
jgi:glycosyltransferase involved in cell wall biosynthesis